MIQTTDWSNLDFDPGQNSYNEVVMNLMIQIIDPTFTMIWILITLSLIFTDSNISYIDPDLNLLEEFMKILDELCQSKSNIEDLKT